MDAEERCGREASQFNRVRAWYSARLVYCSRGVLDVCVLQLVPPDSAASHSFPFMRLRHGVEAMEGSTVYSLGHGQFPPQSELMPTVFRGTLARRAWWRGEVAVLQVRQVVPVLVAVCVRLPALVCVSVPCA